MGIDPVSYIQILFASYLSHEILQPTEKYRICDLRLIPLLIHDKINMSIDFHCELHCKKQDVVIRNNSV